MTQKELLYVEDAIGHEETMISVGKEAINMLEDENLVNFLTKEIKKHETMKEKLLSLLEEKSNE